MLRRLRHTFLLIALLLSGVMVAQPSKKAFGRDTTFDQAMMPKGEGVLVPDYDLHVDPTELDFTGDTAICGVQYQTIKGNRSSLKASEAPCKNGLVNGKWKVYYPGRTWTWRDCDYVNGKREGKYTVYYRTGKPAVITEYHNNKRNGYSRRYGSDGTLTSEMHYVNDSLEGPYVVRGFGKESKGQYHHDAYDGTQSSIDLRTKKTGSVAEYKNGVIRHSIRYNDDGTLDVENNYDSTGKIATITTFSENRPASLMTVTDAQHRRYERFNYMGDLTMSINLLKTPDTALFLPGIDGLRSPFYGYQPDGLCLMIPSAGDPFDSVRWYYHNAALVRREDYPHSTQHLERILSTYHQPRRVDVKNYRKNYRSEIKSESYTVDDKAVWRKLYNHDGILKSQSWWDSTGQLCHLQRYEAGRDSADWLRDPQTGSWTGFGYDNGVLVIKRHYSSDSLRNGEWTEYYRSGALKRRQQYLGGQLNGESISWNEDGSVAEKINYRYGIKEE